MCKVHVQNPLKTRPRWKSSEWSSSPGSRRHVCNGNSGVSDAVWSCLPRPGCGWPVFQTLHCGLQSSGRLQHSDSPPSSDASFLAGRHHNQTLTPALRKNSRHFSVQQNTVLAIVSHEHAARKVSWMRHQKIWTQKLLLWFQNSLNVASSHEPPSSKTWTLYWICFQCGLSQRLVLLPGRKCAERRWWLACQ